MHEPSVLAAAVILLVASNAPAQPPANAGAHYSFEAIDPPDMNPDAVYAFGINNHGDVVGYYRTPSNCNDPGTVCDVGWLKDGQGYRKIYFPNPAGYTYVTGINDSGMIVGRCCGTSAANNPGFAYNLKDGSFEQILVPGAQANFPTSVNSFGVIGGFSEAGTSTTGFLLQNGIFTQIAYPGASRTYVYGVNSGGQAVGVAVTGTASQAFIYQNGTFQQIGYPGAGGTAPYGINDEGDIVGAYSPPGFPDLAYGFIYHNGSFLPFDQPNCNGTIPQGINNHGVIVGKACIGAFIATPQTDGKPSR
jgi:hypothetical protein